MEQERRIAGSPEGRGLRMREGAERRMGKGGSAGLGKIKVKRG